MSKKFFRCQTSFDSPVYFEFAPEDLLAVELRYPGQTVGVYHSHPTGFDRASKTDCQNMQRVNQQQHIPWIWLIICGPFDHAFIDHAKGAIPYNSIIAYHHFEDIGLQCIPIVIEDIPRHSHKTIKSDISAGQCESF